MNDTRWRRNDDGSWSHRPWWKVAINTVLRAFQPQARKMVVYTVCELGPDPESPPRATGYGVGLVLHRPDPRSNARE